ALGVGQNAVGGSGDVAQMARHRHQPEWPAVNFSIGEAVGPLLQVFECEFERVQNGAAYGGDVSVGAAHPGLDIGFGSRFAGHKIPSVEASRFRGTSDIPERV